MALIREVGPTSRSMPALIVFFGRSVVHFDDRAFGSLGEPASGARSGLFWYGERKICAQFFATY